MSGFTFDDEDEISELVEVAIVQISGGLHSAMSEKDSKNFKKRMQIYAISSSSS